MNLEKYNNAFVIAFGVDPSRLNESFAFGVAPEWDSFAHMELVASLEDAFDIMLEPDEMTAFESYEHGKEIMRSHGVEIN